MGITFHHYGLQLLFEDGDGSEIRQEIVGKATRLLTVLSQAESSSDVDMPGYCLQVVKGNVEGFWSVTITHQSRIIFRFGHDGPEDVELVDFH